MNRLFLEDLVKHCEKHNIKFYELTYTEQLAVIRNMLVYLARSVNKKYNKNKGRFEDN